MTAFQPGDVIGGRYRLVRVMGSGASGVVWSARNESTERDFAIKLMLPEAAKDPQRLHRFFKEAKLAGRLRHRCIVEVYDLGRVDDGPLDGAPYLVMELLTGEPLDALLHRVGKLPSGTALRIARDVARGLEVAHRQGVVHRDLKPANVFLHRSLEGVTVPKILDFGISKLLTDAPARKSFDPQETTIGTILGSPAYMSPEQTSGEDLDARADLWSLGVVLYKALSGALPFSAPNFTTLMLAINTGSAPPLEERVPGLPREVAALVHKCLSRRRGERYASAAALADAIDSLLDRFDLPVLELSQIVGDLRPLPSEHMKTLEVEAIRKVQHDPHAETRPCEVTRPVDETFVDPRDSIGAFGATAQRDTERRIDDAPLPDEPRAVTADVTDGNPLTVTPPPPRSSRRAAGGLLVLAAAVAVVSVFVSRTPTPPSTSASASPPAAAPSSAAAAAPSPSPVTQAAPVASLTAPPAASVSHAVVAKPAPKAAPPKTTAKPKSASHEGLVRPGF
ncbi:MAG: serine/threonine protein kinase [Deltaproteobacteria bacterium]|nr:serine/threonine protein kinase [Deltaproteobacteria bacterium]